MLDHKKTIEQYDESIKEKSEALKEDKSVLYLDMMRREEELATQRFERVREYKNYLVELVKGVSDQANDYVVENTKKAIQRLREVVRATSQNLRQLRKVRESIENAIQYVPGFDPFNSDDDYERRKLLEYIDFDLEGCEEVWQEKLFDYADELQTFQNEPGE